MLNDEFKNWLKDSAEKYKQDIRKRDTYPQIKELYDKVVSDYLKELKQYPYTIHQINEYQRAIVFDCGHLVLNQNYFHHQHLIMMKCINYVVNIQFILLI